MTSIVHAASHTMAPASVNGADTRRPSKSRTPLHKTPCAKARIAFATTIDSSSGMTFRPAINAVAIALRMKDAPQYARAVILRC